MEDRKEEVQQQQEDKEEGKQQEGELEEKLWEVGEFLVTLVDNGRSVVARKDDLPLLPRSTKDFTPFLTELVLKNVSPLRKADPDLLQQGREWLMERLRGGKELELHCIGNPDYRDGIVQVNVGARTRDIGGQEIITKGYGRGHAVAGPKKKKKKNGDLMSKNKQVSGQKEILQSEP
ncbi:uncharacterized protein LOC143030296 [Oratosquilla oratoria]|uniref:uncharacterized protein LOC143030296 n=1 Tax=Oratosquilla oratoria TaxID=337810 RepID=UPI003F7779A8